MTNKAFLWLAGTLAGTALLGLGRPVLAAAPRMDPNDTFYGSQWYLDAIKAPEAWAVATSSGQGVVVAVIDGGMDDTHPDLAGALWTNPEEIPNDGKDNDGNGYVDDVHGWNYVLSTSSTRPVTSLVVREGAWQHGTAVAALIAGRGNDDIGMAGLAWRAKIIPLVILGADGSGGTDRLVSAIQYASSKRADIINLSLEGDTLDPEVEFAIREATAKGALVVIAAGNGQDGQGTDLDDEPLYPSCHTGAANAGTLTVAATDQSGARLKSSNFGACVTLSAPGAQILSARPTYNQNGNHQDVSGYGAWNGTSLAAPLVSGVAALLKAQHPEWNGEQLAKRITDTVGKLPVGVTGMGKGLLDAAAAVGQADANIYGPWNLFASEPGKPPRVWVTDAMGKALFDIPAGNAGDKRGMRAAFVHWSGSRSPEILVTAKNDEKGEWRVYRTDGVLIAAGQISRDANDKIKGGLLLATQDLDASGLERILFTEANGSRVWPVRPGWPAADPVVMAKTQKPLGVLAVGIQRPSQTFLLMTRESQSSFLSVLDANGVTDGTSVTTTRPQALDMVAGRERDGREVIRLTQSGPPSFLAESSGMMVAVGKAAVTRWKQAPQGLFLFGFKDRRFYDTWPR